MPRRIETAIEIKTPPSEVWKALMAFSDYGAWNPFIVSIEGDPSVGGKLAVELHPPEGRPMRFKPTVHQHDPERLFSWRGRLGIPGLFDGEHRFQMDSADGRTTRFVHEEEFSGLLVPLLWKMMESNTRRGFESMNLALKQHCESTHNV